MSELEKLERLEALVSSLDVSESEESDEESEEEEKIGSKPQSEVEPIPVQIPKEACVGNEVVMREISNITSSTGLRSGVIETTTRSESLSKLFLSVDNVVNVARKRMQEQEEEEEEEEEEEDEEEMGEITLKRSPAKGKQEMVFSLSSLTDIVYEENGNISFPFEVDENLQDITDPEKTGLDENRDFDDGIRIDEVSRFILQVVYCFHFHYTV